MGVSTRKYLNKRQLALIDSLFKGKSSESRVLKRHGVSTVVYRGWLANKVFAGEVAFRIEGARRESRIIIAKNSRKAAKKLVELADSEKEETARRACLDIVSGAGLGEVKKQVKSTAMEKDKFNAKISPKAASKLLKTLAEEKKHGKK